MDELDIKGFFEQYGPVFIQELKNALDQNYDYSPGYFGNAYSNGRKKAFGGSASKVNTGSLRDSIEGSYQNGEFIIQMLAYWRYVNDGREPGKKKEKTYTSKKGKRFKRTTYSGFPPVDEIQKYVQKKFGLSGKELDRATFAVGYNIARFGIQPTDFYEKASLKFEAIIEQNLTDFVDDYIGEFYDRTIKENL